MGVYLVTGCAGFIGAKVSEFLLNDCHKVIGVDNLNDAYDVRLKHWRLKKLYSKRNFDFHRLDICDQQDLQTLFSRTAMSSSHSSPVFDAVINLAARAGVRQSVENPWIYIATNAIGTLNLLELSRKYEVPKYVLASTSSLYGQSSSMPYREDADTSHPISPYASSKKAAESLCYTYHFLYDLDVTVFRYFTVYGPAGRPDMMPFRITQWINEGNPIRIFGDGLQSRDFTYIDDIARGTIAGLKPLGYEIINLGSDKPVVLMDAIRIIENLIGRPSFLEFEPRHKADVTSTWADIDKAKQVLQWHPVVQIEEGLRNLTEWYKENQEWASKVNIE